MQARQEYANGCKNGFSITAVKAISTLLKLNMPSITAADEALIRMEGAGGTELEASA